MTTRNFYQTIITLFIILTFNSCTQESVFDETQAIDTSFKIVPLAKSNNYTKNYEVNSTTTKIDIANDIISLEIPVPLADYSLLRVYNISTENNAAILYLITRGNTEEVAKLPTNYVIQTNVSISELDLDINLLENGNGLRIFVMNNSQELDLNSNTYNCLVDKVNKDDVNANKCIENAKAADGPRFYNGGIILM